MKKKRSSVFFAPIADIVNIKEKYDYQADYEYDLPTDSSPVEVNSIVNGDVGSITDDAMYATLLDLIDRKFFKVISSSDDDTVLRLVNSDTSNLKTFERLLINFILLPPYFVCGQFGQT